MVLIRIFPYSVDFKLKNDSPRFWKRKFKQSNISKNLKPYGVHFLVIVVKEVTEGNMVLGKILKLRSDRPKKIKKSTGIETTIQLDDDENIVESTNFIYYINDHVILAEYNYHAVRHIRAPLTKYFEKRFKKDIEIISILDMDTLKRMKKDPKFKKLKVRVARENLSQVQKTLGISMLRSLLSRVTRDEHATIEIIISKGRSRKGLLNKRKTLEITNELVDTLGEDGLEQLKIVGEDAEYDILHGNLMSFHAEISVIDGVINSSEFYIEADRRYRRNRENILQTFKKLG